MDGSFIKRVGQSFRLSRSSSSSSLSGGGVSRSSSILQTLGLSSSNEKIDKTNQCDCSSGAQRAEHEALMTMYKAALVKCADQTQTLKKLEEGTALVLGTDDSVSGLSFMKQKLVEAYRTISQQESQLTELQAEVDCHNKVDDLNLKMQLRTMKYMLEKECKLNLDFQKQNSALQEERDNLLARAETAENSVQCLRQQLKDAEARLQTSSLLLSVKQSGSHQSNPQFVADNTDMPVVYAPAPATKALLSAIDPAAAPTQSATAKSSTATTEPSPRSSDPGPSGGKHSSTGGQETVEEEPGPMHPSELIDPSPKLKSSRPTTTPLDVKSAPPVAAATVANGRKTGTQSLSKVPPPSCDVNVPPMRRPSPIRHRRARRDSGSEDDAAAVPGSPKVPVPSEFTAVCSQPSKGQISVVLNGVIKAMGVPHVIWKVNSDPQSRLHCKGDEQSDDDSAITALKWVQERNCWEWRFANPTQLLGVWGRKGLGVQQGMGMAMGAGVGARSLLHFTFRLQDKYFGAEDSEGDKLVGHSWTCSHVSVSKSKTYKFIQVKSASSV